MKKTREITYRSTQLSPYPGEVRLFKNAADLRGHYEKHVGPYPYTNDQPKGGRFIYLEASGNSAKDVYLVYAGGNHALAHELAHVCLHTFQKIGSDPREGNGEPFCYLLSQLILDLRGDK